MEVGKKPARRSQVRSGNLTGTEQLDLVLGREILGTNPRTKKAKPPPVRLPAEVSLSAMNQKLAQSIHRWGLGFNPSPITEITSYLSNPLRLS
jgi:hypothetical protein